MLRRLLKLILLSLPLVFVFTFTNNSFAAEEKIKLSSKVTQKTEERLTLEWESVKGAKEYKVYQESEVIYKGDQKRLEIQSLDEGQQLDFIIVALDKNKQVITNSNLSVSSLSNDHLFDIEVIADPEEVYISWDNNFKNAKYSIFQNGMSIRTQNDSFFVIKNPKKGENQLEVLIEYKNKYNETDYYTLTIPYSVSKKFDKVKEIEEVIFSTTSAHEEVSNFRHRTFIQAGDVQWPNFQDDYFVEGDGRSRPFSPTSGTHRSMLSISVNWTEGISTTAKDVGESVLFLKRNGRQVIDRATASSSGMSAVKRSQSGSVAYFHVNHNVSVPFKVYWILDAPSIGYSYNLHLFKNGSTAISGKHTAYPWHEIYHRKPNSDSWTSVREYTPSGGPFGLFEAVYFGVD